MFLTTKIGIRICILGNCYHEPWYKSLYAYKACLSYVCASKTMFEYECYTTFALRDVLQIFYYETGFRGVWASTLYLMNLRFYESRILEFASCSAYGTACWKSGYWSRSALSRSIVCESSKSLLIVFIFTTLILGFPRCHWPPTCCNCWCYQERYA